MINRISQHLGLSTDASTAESAREAAEEVSAQARETFQSATETVRAQIIEHPARSLAIALAVGVTLGWIIKRR